MIEIVTGLRRTLICHKLYVAMLFSMWDEAQDQGSLTRRNSSILQQVINRDRVMTPEVQQTMPGTWQRQIQRCVMHDQAKHHTMSDIDQHSLTGCMTDAGQTTPPQAETPFQPRRHFCLRQSEPPPMQWQEAQEVQTLLGQLVHDPV